MLLVLDCKVVSVAILTSHCQRAHSVTHTGLWGPTGKLTLHQGLCPGFFLTTQLKRDTISLSAMSPYFNPLSSFYHCTKMCLVSLHLLDLNPL